MAAINVIVIEDDDTAALNVKESLRRAGFEVSAVISSPSQVIEKAEIYYIASFEESLRESEYLFSSFFKSSPYGFALTDDKGSVIECNLTMEQYTGLEISEVIGRPVWDVYSMVAFREDDLDALLSQRDAIRDFFNGDGDQHLDVESEISIEGDDGQRRIIQVSIFPIKTGTGNMLGVISKDITSIREAENALKSSENAYIADALGPKVELPDGIFKRSSSNFARSRLQLASDLADFSAHEPLNKCIVDVLRDRCRRDTSLSMVYDVLSRSIDLDRIAFKKFISNLTNAIAKSRGIEPSKPSFRLMMDEAMLKLQSAMSCGLIVNELISRSLTRGFPDGQEGEICIEFKSLGASIYRLSIIDNGIGHWSVSTETAEAPLVQILNPFLKEIDGCMRVNEAYRNRLDICFNELKYDARLRQLRADSRKGMDGR